jgi:NAD(P)-dependent dehydrogenase (short-subunit alcohol dehydrogenase family)
MAARLEGKVAIVTGASRGIGQAIAEAMAREGARVVLASRKQDALDAVAEGIRASGGTALPLACHTGKEDQVADLVRKAADAFGQVDVLVNNAATNPYFGPMMDIDWGAWDKTFEVNLKGYFAATRAVVRHLQGRGAPGSIVNVASVVGMMGAPFQGVYAMTKAAVISMTKTLAVELGGAGIRINGIAPGLIETRFSQALTTNDAIKAHVLDRCAIKRVGQPEEIAGAAVFLASDEASYLTGVTLPVDAGWTAG